MAIAVTVGAVAVVPLISTAMSAHAKVVPKAKHVFFKSDTTICRGVSTPSSNGNVHCAHTVVSK